MISQRLLSSASTPCLFIIVTLQLKDNIECIHLMCAPGIVTHISRQINRSIITMYIHHIITSRSCGRIARFSPLSGRLPSTRH
jgi:hypothetical protein